MNAKLKKLIYLIALLAVPGVLPALYVPDIFKDLFSERAYAQVKMLDKQREQAEQLEKAKKEAERAQKGKAPAKKGKKETDQEKKDRLFFKDEEAEEVKLPKQAPAISPETFRMIEMIEKKNTELKKREEELTAKEQQLRTLQKNIRKDLEKIEQALAESKEQLGLKKSLIKENVDALVKVYSSMKPAEAANLIAAIDQDLALQIISGMKSKIAGQVLSQLDVKVAKAISEKLAGKSSGDSNN
ncbi:hypothetical protein UR09_05555 [Candidatus Nitromaritima sp. SCGC AAA799-A02]|nr:hypothetical protein UR09_05555 [Candidatus Nitromaritima sp. SCGC AAA799-A02]KMP10954.1 hypothetical protein UZ36_06030 [Candidatus Nitromaritima sp. SCGC AAA799-C22]